MLICIALLATGCFATRTDLMVLLEQQKQLAQRLSRMQDHLADLTLRVQGLHTEVREIHGEMVVVDREQQPLFDQIAMMQERIARIEQQDQLAKRMQSYQQERLQADLMTLNTPQEMFEAAVSSYALAATDRAVALFSELQRKWPGDHYATAARVKLGGIYAQQGAHLEAIDALLGVIENAPKNPWAPEAYLSLGQMLIAIEQVDTGEQLLQDLLVFYPASPQTAPAQAVLDELLAARIAATAPTELTAPVALTAPAELTAPITLTAATELTAPTALTAEVLEIDDVSNDDDVLNRVEVETESLAAPPPITQISGPVTKPADPVTQEASGAP